MGYGAIHGANMPKNTIDPARISPIINLLLAIILLEAERSKFVKFARFIPLSSHHYPRIYHRIQEIDYEISNQNGGRL